MVGETRSFWSAAEPSRSASATQTPAERRDRKLGRGLHLTDARKGQGDPVCEVSSLGGHSSSSWWSAFTMPMTVLVLAIGLLPSCAGPSFYPRAIHETEDRYVRLEARYGPGQEGEALRFSHPVPLSETEWSRILEGVHVKPHRWILPIGNQEVTLEPVFDEHDRQYLATYLAKAFSKARGDEWVLFYMSDSREPKVAEITSGGFFVEGDDLHLVLANYRQPVSMSFIQQKIWRDPLSPSGKTYYEIIPGEHQTLQTYWRWYPTKPLLAHPSELVIDYRAILSLSERPAATNVAPGGTRYELEKKLRILQRLRGQGLITEEEYRLKRAKLLDEL